MDVKEKTVHEAISGIDDKFIEEAADMGSGTGKEKFRFIRRTAVCFASAAACLALVILGGNALRMSRVNVPVMQSENAVGIEQSSDDRDLNAAASSADETVEGAVPEATNESFPAVTEESVPESTKQSGSVEAARTEEDRIEAVEGGICIPAAGFAMTEDPPEGDEERHSYKVILYGFFDESEINEGATGYYENGYGELSMCTSYEEMLSKEAERLVNLGFDASVYVACGSDFSEYGLTVMLTGKEAKDFPCSEKYGYILKLNE